MNPYYGICTYVGFNIIRPEMLFWGGNTGNLIFKISLGCSIIGYLRKAQNFKTICSYRELWLIFFIWLGMALSLLVFRIPFAFKSMVLHYGNVEIFNIGSVDIRGYK